jgi:hypothetical protein
MRGAYVLTRPGERVRTQFVSKFSKPGRVTYWTDDDMMALRFPDYIAALDASVGVNSVTASIPLGLGMFGLVEIKTLAAARAENLAFARAK